MTNDEWLEELGPVIYPPKRPTIDELEAILMREDEEAIEILPNGEIRRGGQPKAQKPLTMRENLGGEYGADFAAQVADLSNEDGHEWLQRACREAAKIGMTHMVATYFPEHDLRLLEAWKVKPDPVPAPEPFLGAKVAPAPSTNAQQ